MYLAGELLGRQREQPGQGGLNLSVALEMTRTEERDRAKVRNRFDRADRAATRRGVPEV